MLTSFFEKYCSGILAETILISRELKLYIFLFKIRWVI